MAQRHDRRTGVTPQHERQVEFATRQLLDVLSPAHFVVTNPEVLQRTHAEGGRNLVRRFWNFVEDWERAVNGRKPVGADAFQVGENLGLTPGKVADLTNAPVSQLPAHLSAHVTL